MYNKHDKNKLRMFDLAWDFVSSVMLIQTTCIVFKKIEYERKANILCVLCRIFVWVTFKNLLVFPHLLLLYSRTCIK